MPRFQGGYRVCEMPITYYGRSYKRARRSLARGVDRAVDAGPLPLHGLADAHVPIPRDGATRTLRRQRRKSRILAVGIWSTVASSRSPRHRRDDWPDPVSARTKPRLLRSRSSAALLDLLLSETALVRIRAFADDFSRPVARLWPLDLRTALAVAAAAAVLWIAGGW